FLRQICSISLLEFWPSLEIMAKPFSQFITWRDFLHPDIHLGLVLFHRAWPQSIHEHAPPVTLLCWLIDSFDLNHIHTRHSTRYILSASEQPIHLFIQNRALKIFGVVTIIEKRFCNFARRTERRSRGSRTEARPR